MSVRSLARLNLLLVVLLLTNLMQRWLFLAGLGIFLLVTTACSHSNQRAPYTPTATVMTCRPPCWKGITPGQTSREQVLKILGPSKPVESIDELAQ
jgi:hypothetical protein